MVCVCGVLLFNLFGGSLGAVAGGTRHDGYVGAVCCCAGRGEGLDFGREVCLFPAAAVFVLMLVFAESVGRRASACRLMRRENAATVGQWRQFRSVGRSVRGWRPPNGVFLVL